MIPASIRNKNPGAMWPNSAATKFGSKRYEQLNDKQRNKIATFDTCEDGCAATFYLWMTSKNYIGQPLGSAIRTWSGNNSPTAYAQKLASLTGMTMNSIVTLEFLQSPRGIAFMKAQAEWEAGQPFPATDDDWKRGQLRAMEALGKIQPHHKAVVAGTAAGTVAYGFGFSPLVVVGTVLLIAAVVYFVLKKKG